MKTIHFILFFLFPFYLTCQVEYNFKGPYLGARMGFQNVFGGSNIGGFDVLAEKYQLVVESFTGMRIGTRDDKLIGGAEISLGFFDGQLQHRDPISSLSIDYTTTRQFSYGGHLGSAFGLRKNIFVFLYGHETKRKFDVNITQNDIPFSQTDKQGMFKYGLGVEFGLISSLDLIFTTGRIRVDFGGKPTNIQVDDQYEIMIGLLWHM